MRQRGKLKYQRRCRCGYAGKRCRQYEGKELVTVGLVAKRNCACFVLADGLEYLAERRVDNATDQQEAAEKNQQHGNVHVSLLGEIEQPEQFSPRHRLNAVLAVGKRGL